MRPLVAKDLSAAYEAVARQACAIINDHQDEARPQLFFFQMNDKEPGKFTAVHTINERLVLELHNSEHGKEALKTAIAATLGDDDASPFPLREAMLSVGVRPDIAIQVTEAWAADDVPDDDPLRQVAPSKRADRREVLMVLAHVKGHTTGQMMPIRTVDGRRRVEYRPLVSAKGGILGGDMAMQGWDDTPEEHKPPYAKGQ